jgi:dipeptidyl aminopeptidase/acylaminoacyl peptidase
MVDHNPPAERPAAFAASDGRSLAGILNHPPGDGPFPAVVLCHGFGSGKDSPINRRLAAVLGCHGVASLRFDFTGHGASAGDIAGLTVAGGAEQVAAALRYLEARSWVNRAALGLAGHSFGGAVALRAAAADRRARALLLLAPVSDYVEVKMRKLGPASIRAWRERGYNEEDTEFGMVRLNYSFYADAAAHDTYALARDIAATCLIVHGADDQVVPLAQSRALAAALGGRAELTIVPGADHTLTGPQGQANVVRDAARWLADHMTYCTVPPP